MVPLTVPVNVITPLGEPLQTDWLPGVPETVGVGFTIYSKLPDVPIQPFAEGITVTTAITDVLPLFVASKDAILPLPVVASPMPGVVLDHV